VGQRAASRLLVLGLDACDGDFLREHASCLPTLGRLWAEGRGFRTETPKRLGGAAWPTFALGRHPGHHGIYRQQLWDPERMALRCVDLEAHPQRPFWTDLEACGEHVAAVDVPYAWPGSLQRGLEIIDWATASPLRPFACNQATVAARIRRDFGRSPSRERAVQPGSCRRFVDELTQSAACKAELLAHLIRELHGHVWIAVFGELQRAGRALPTVSAPGETEPAGGEAVHLGLYRALDRAVARVLEAVDLRETNVLLFSLHGMTPDRGQGHAARVLMDRVNEQFLERFCGAASPRLGDRNWLRQIREHVPVRVQRAVGGAAPEAMRHWLAERELLCGLSWRRTPGFALQGSPETELRLNLRGREARGLLEPGSCLHHRYLEWLRKAIEPLRDADTGAPLVDGVLGVHELFPGPRVAALPDLTIAWRPSPPAHRLASPELGVIEVTAPPARGNTHTDSGFALLVGPDAARDSLPPLHEAADYAGFIRELAGLRG